MLHGKIKIHKEPSFSYGAYSTYPYEDYSAGKFTYNFLEHKAALEEAKATGFIIGAKVKRKNSTSSLFRHEVGEIESYVEGAQNGFSTYTGKYNTVNVKWNTYTTYYPTEDLELVE